MDDDHDFSVDQSHGNINYDNNHNHNHNHNHNIRKDTDNDKSTINGYPDHEIQFNHIADPSARKYCKYLEKNIRREQNHHIEEFNKYLKQLQDLYLSDYDQFNQQFVWKINIIKHDSETNNKHIFMIHDNDNHNHNHKCHLGETNR